MRKGVETAERKGESREKLSIRQKDESIKIKIKNVRKKEREWEGRNNKKNRNKSVEDGMKSQRGKREGKNQKPEKAKGCKRKKEQCYGNPKGAAERNKTNKQNREQLRRAKKKKKKDKGFRLTMWEDRVVARKKKWKRLWTGGHSAS